MKRVLRNKYLLLLTIAAASIALNGCSGEKTGKSNTHNSQEESSTGSSVGRESLEGGSITVGIPQDIGDSLDPHMAVGAGTKEILFNIFEGLVKPDEKGNLQPAVASDYQISGDGLTYSFTLREGIQFQNGNPVTVEDIKYSIDRCADTSNGGPLVSAFSNIEKVEIADETHIEIILKEVDSEFLAYLTTAIIPKESEPAKEPIGTGPFKYVSRSPQENIILEKNQNYWGEAAHLDEVVFKVVADADTIVTNLKSGSIDMYARLTSNQVQELKDDVNIEEGMMNLVQALYLNHEDPLFQDARVRQALSYAVNPQEIMDFIADGKGTEIGSSMFPRFEKYYVESLKDYYTTDINKAKQLLAEAGYPDGFELKITVPSNYQPHIDTAQVLIEQLKQVGIHATIELIEWDSWLNDVYGDRNYQATVVGVDAPELTARSLLERFNSDNRGNFINYSNAQYDNLFEKAISEKDPQEQVKEYKELQTILTEDAANVYIQDLADFVGLSKKFDGYKFYPLYIQDMASIYRVEE
jgi:peptide/nickel transport system substrate-binding protein